MLALYAQVGRLMRKVVAKRLRKALAVEFPHGSSMVRRASGALYWTGYKRAYRDAKREYSKG